MIRGVLILILLIFVMISIGLIFLNGFTGFAINEGATTYICGDFNNDGKINSVDIVYLTNYIFKAGPSPNPVWKGDVNADGKIASNDIVYLINYVFKSGPKPICIQEANIKYFGAVGDGVADDTLVIKDAINYAKENSVKIYVPEGVYIYSSHLSLKGVEMFGEGENSVLSAVNPLDAAIFLEGVAPEVRKIKIISNANARDSSLNAHGITVYNSQNFKIEEMIIYNSAGAGVMIYGSSQGEVVGNEISNSWADGIHITNKSNNVTVKSNILTNTGDDSIAVVSYIAQGEKTHNIIVDNNHISNSKTRGISLMGDNLYATNNIVKNTRCAGIYSVSENSYNLFDSRNILIENNEIENTTLDVFSPTNCYEQAGIHIEGRLGYLFNNITIKNNILINANSRGILSNYGKGVLIDGNNLNKVSTIGISVYNTEDAIIDSNELGFIGMYGVYIENTASGIINVISNLFKNINTQRISYVDVVNCQAGNNQSLFIIIGNHYIPGNYTTERYVECFNPNVIIENNTISNSTQVSLKPKTVIFN